ncbi:lactonase family protein [Burkholderia sp. 22PA0106]|uniref:lactonase family protein n=1 Tax=Burkholderia sp. 22PA0106 TaxID=3237371 RepID=UPI0039C02894
MPSQVPSRHGPNPKFAYVGSRTTRERNAHGDGISVFRVDEQTGALSLVQVLGGLANPSFLALSADGRHLYAVHGDLSDISAMSVDPVSGQLTFVNRQSTQGRNPVYLAIDPTGRFVVVSNYQGSSLAVLPIAADGSLEPVSQRVHLDGPIGPHRIEQTQSKPHSNPFDPSGRHVIVPDKGLDRIFSFRFMDGTLSPAPTPFVVSREGAGPRHIAFAPNGRVAWVVDELDSTVTSYRYDQVTGALHPFQVLSTLPESFTGNSRASEIELDRSGRFVYVSNRGDDTISVFAVEPSGGALRFVGAQSTLGRTPRFITSSPNGRFMYALNEESDTIVAFSVNAADGSLAPTGLVVKSGSPVCMVFSR